MGCVPVDGLAADRLEHLRRREHQQLAHLPYPTAPITSGVHESRGERMGAHRKDLADGGGEGFDLTPHPFPKPPAQTDPTHLFIHRWFIDGWPLQRSGCGWRDARMGEASEVFAHGGGPQHPIRAVIAQRNLVPRHVGSARAGQREARGQRMRTSGLRLPSGSWMPPVAGSTNGTS